MGLLFRLFRRLFYFVLLVFIAPALVSLGIWEAQADRPTSWSNANWSSASILPPPDETDDAAVYVMAARTGRWKGAFSVHSWIVVKRRNAAQYQRYDKVGWGSPIRRNAYAADANWYSNAPVIVKSFHGNFASNLIPQIEKAIEAYPHSERGDYQIWPGPNSNSFIAHVLNAVPDMGVVLPANAVGRDFPTNSGFVQVDPDWSNVQFNIHGYFGVAMGKRSGIEIQFFGLVAGIQFEKPALKLPGIGNVYL
ncbi:MAG: DUF3750 domain-containing protein [Pseudomonadota bacterium]